MQLASNDADENPFDVSLRGDATPETLARLATDLGHDPEAIAARMASPEVQAVIDTMPEQYYWVHKRFKTRPEGEDSVY